jgi:hypothetical protein
MGRLHIFCTQNALLKIRRHSSKCPIYVDPLSRTLLLFLFLTNHTERIIFYAKKLYIITIRDTCVSLIFTVLDENLTLGSTSVPLLEVVTQC